MNRRITYLTTGLARAGAEKQLLLLGERMLKAGWDVRIISMLPPDAYATEIGQLGIPLVSLNLKKKIPDPRIFLRLIQTLRMWKPDVIHCHQVHANIAGRLTQLFISVPVVVCTAHSLSEGPRWRQTYRLTDSLCDLTTNVCQAGVDGFIRVGAAPADKIRFVPNGVDCNVCSESLDHREAVREELRLNNEFLWLAVGNLREPKGYPTMLEAFRRILAARPDARLFIAGDGPLKTILEGLAKRNGIANAVLFLGSREDIPLLMRASDGFLMSSHSEGMPMALLEASAAGLPTVATLVGGVPEVVVNGDGGVLVKPNDPDALARACLKVMNSTPERRRELGDAGRMRVESMFDLDAVVKEWQEIYFKIWRRKQHSY